MSRTVLLGLITIVSCSSPDAQVFKLSSSKEANALATFTSVPNDSARVSLRLKEDSTFLLDIANASVAPQRIEGALRIDSIQYQLFFSDSVEQINELITPIHQDASVVVYPDHSVALERALSQFYVRGILVTKDSAFAAK